MPTYNDAWLMNESLAFYMSTNTFSNPIFNCQTSDQLDPIPHSSQNAESSISSSNNSDNNNSNSNGTSNTNSDGQLWKTFCDSLAFSLRSKIYVLKVDFKRRFEGLRRFTSNHLACVFAASSRLSQRRRPQHQQQSSLADLSSAERLQSQSRFPADKFWRNLESSSRRDSFGHQKEKILSRLEQVVRAKRANEQPSLFNLERPESALRPSSSAPTFASAGEPSGEPSAEPRASAGRRCPALSEAWTRMRRGAKARRSTGSRWISDRRQALGAAGGLFASNKKLCIVCYSNAPNILTLPCRHHEICSDCFIEIIYVAVKQSQYPLKCVLCRQKVERIRCSRRLLLSVIEKNRIRP